MIGPGYCERCGCEMEQRGEHGEYAHCPCEAIRPIPGFAFPPPGVLAAIVEIQRRATPEAPHAG